MVTKEEMDIILKGDEEAKRDFKNRCFMVIGALVRGDIVNDDIEKLKNDIYEIAHIGIGTCGNKHEDWAANMEKLFKAFEKGGLL